MNKNNIFFFITAEMTHVNNMVSLYNNQHNKLI